MIFQIFKTLCVSFFTLFICDSFAEESLKLKQAINITDGRYSDSTLLSNQQSIGVRTSIESVNYGGAIGFQKTRINMQEASNLPQQSQNSTYFSAHKNEPAPLLYSYITYKIDLHYIQNSSSTQSIVHVLAPEISWTSAKYPLTFGINFASSNYPNMPSVKQHGIHIGFGFNNQKEWLELRQYKINNLDPLSSEQHSNTVGHEIRFTHLFSHIERWHPDRITLGIETGNKIYHVDMASQTVYNLSMLNTGGYSISAAWKVSNSSKLTLHASQNKYLSSLSGQPNTFTLSNISAQTSFSW